MTGSIENGDGMTTADGRKLAFRGLSKPLVDSEDEDRVTRHLKKGRIVAVEKMLPPRDFSAGSILQRTSGLLSPVLEEGKKTAFIKPDIAGKEIEIAMAFYRSSRWRRTSACGTISPNWSPMTRPTCWPPPMPIPPPIMPPVAV